MKTIITSRNHFGNEIELEFDEATHFCAIQSSVMLEKDFFEDRLAWDGVQGLLVSRSNDYGLTPSLTWEDYSSLLNALEQADKAYREAGESRKSDRVYDFHDLVWHCAHPDC